MKYKVTLNGRTYEVEVEKGSAIVVDEYEAAAPQAPAPVAAPQAAPQAAAAPVPAPAAPAASASANAVKAPLPGTILGIKASVGQAVKAGEVVLTIEAMKMENEITAPKAGTITSILVQKGMVVNQGAPLFELA